MEKKKNKKQVNIKNILYKHYHHCDVKLNFIYAKVFYML